MIGFFRDPAWQFVGVVLALAALVVSLLIYWLQRQKKSLSYEILSKNQLLTVKEALEGRLQVLYEGQPAQNICLLFIRLFNSGNVPIPASDYERKISLSIGTSSKILSGVVTNVYPKNLAIDISIEENRVTLQPILLNSKDSVTLKLLVSDFNANITVDGRIVGVKSITKSNQTHRLETLLTLFAWASFIVGAYLIFNFTPKQYVRPPMPIEAKIGISLIGWALGVITASTIFNMIGRDRIRTIFRRVRGLKERSN